MIIDFHTHTFPDQIAAPTIEKLSQQSHTKAFCDGTNAGLRASMAQSGVDWSVVMPVATNERQVVRVNDASAKLNQEGQGLLSFGCMHPDFSDWKHELARIADLGIKGVKLHPIYQGVDFDDPRYLRILDRCGELGLVVLTHAGLDIGFPGKANCSPEMILHAVQEVGPIQLVLAHMGSWRCWDRVLELLPGRGLWLDTAYSLGVVAPLGDGYYGPADLKLMEHREFLALVRAFGSDHVLFGTDSPWFSQRRGLELLRELPLTPEEQSAILGGNAQRLLGL